jgi:subtilisin family serine protease/subtilisin-like proprotein convertase family protein
MQFCVGRKGAVTSRGRLASAVEFRSSCYIFFGIFLSLIFAANSLLGEQPGPRQFRFRLPQAATFTVGSQASTATLATASDDWVEAQDEGNPAKAVHFGSRIVLQLQANADWSELTNGHPLRLARTIQPGLFILEAPDPLTAMREADRLATHSEVVASYPVLRRKASLDGAYAPQPTDANFFYEWHLEHRNQDGTSAGPDVNVRGAWPYTTGEGIVVAVGDCGMELSHPELASRVSGQPHFNFVLNNTNAVPVNRRAAGAHGTEVAGLIGADINHARTVGVSPGATLASWVVVDTNSVLASDERLMEMYGYASNLVSVENFSWGHEGLDQSPISLLEQVGISNAITLGRSGRGTVMVRSAGNDRLLGGNANDDGYPADPRVITVAAVRLDGRVASYSDPGACVLVAAPSGDFDTTPTGLFTTDLLGTDGANFLFFLPPNDDLSGYSFNSLGFSGTSAATPLISGVAALLLSAQPELTWRDVQQILLLSARHYDFADPDLRTNGAGLLVSHNVGFGVPDAGVAVQLALQWTNRPPATTVTLVATNPAAIPPEGLRVLVTGPNIPAFLSSIQALPSTGPQVDSPTPLLRLADFGFGTNGSGFNVAGKGALIQRDSATFASKVNLAAQSGASLAIVYNFATNTSGSGAPGGNQLLPMGATDFVPIPAVFIGHDDGMGLLDVFTTNASARAQVRMAATNYTFNVTNTLICEHVGVRLQTDYPLRGNLRITLVSPSGIRSVLQRYNGDTHPGPVDWTYFSVHHFFESTAGNWTVNIGNQGPEGLGGTVQSVSLVLEGVAIQDSDRDGLEDSWELQHFGSLASRAQEDPDADGYSNAIEQILGTDPTSNNNLPFLVDLSPWDSNWDRLSWPSSARYHFEIWGGTDAGGLSLLATVPGHFPQTEWFVRREKIASRFYQVRAVLNL